MSRASRITPELNFFILNSFVLLCDKKARNTLKIIEKTPIIANIWRIGEFRKTLAVIDSSTANPPTDICEMSKSASADKGVDVAVIVQSSMSLCSQQKNPEFSTTFPL